MSSVATSRLCRWRWLPVVAGRGLRETANAAIRVCGYRRRRCCAILGGGTAIDRVVRGNGRPRAGVGGTCKAAASRHRGLRGGHGIH